jgi:hypothetical protein
MLHKKTAALAAFLLHLEYLPLLHVLEASKWKYKDANVNTSCLTSKKRTGVGCARTPKAHYMFKVPLNYSLISRSL